MTEIQVGVSARHVHLSKTDLEILFGRGYELTVLKSLTQPGEFASTDKVTIKSDSDFIENVRVLGPFRDYTQVEISRTDSHKLGLNPPVRNSKDIEGSEKITIVGPMGETTKPQGCIIATRHIHLPEEDTNKCNLNNGDVVSIKVNGEKSGIMNNVHVKTGNYCFELHIDTDDANAFLLKNGDTVEIISNN